jgi:iron-sulfur cluster repair protein YtfE (RIC family)
MKQTIEELYLKLSAKQDHSSFIMCVRTSEQMQERYRETLQELINFPPHIVARVLGEDNYREGMATILQALQHPELNQHVCLSLSGLLGGSLITLHLLLSV